MANYPLPVKGVAYKMEIGLVSQASTLLLQSNPTLAAGDAKVAKDDGALANLTTLPYSTNADKRVEVAFSATEMNADNVTLIMSDVAGAQWCDQLQNIQTATRGIDDLAYPATSGRSILVNSDGSVAPDWANVKSPTTANNLSGTTIKDLSATGLDNIVMSDITAVPGITASLKAALNWMFVLARNLRTQSTSTETVYKDDGTTAIGTSAKSDNGTTFSRGKYG